jgi:hypothetical protein
MKAHLILAAMLVVAAITITEAQATDETDRESIKNAPNFYPTITKDPTNEKVEIVEFKCKLKES